MFAVSTSNVSTQFGTQTKKISSSVRSRKSCHQKKIVTITKAAFKTDNSQRIFKEAQDLLPGGVNSPVRAFKSVGGQPIVFDRVKGPCALFRFSSSAQVASRLDKTLFSLSAFCERKRSLFFFVPFSKILSRKLLPL